MFPVLHRGCLLLHFYFKTCYKRVMGAPESGACDCDEADMSGSGGARPP